MLPASTHIVRCVSGTLARSSRLAFQIFLRLLSEQLELPERIAYAASLPSSLECRSLSALGFCEPAQGTTPGGERTAVEVEASYSATPLA